MRTCAGSFARNQAKNGVIERQQFAPPRTVIRKSLASSPNRASGARLEFTNFKKNQELFDLFRLAKD
jgi:hypothetical protein